MASDPDYVQYVIDQLKIPGAMTYKKMFGEYLIYLNNKPVVMNLEKNMPTVKKKHIKYNRP